MNPTCFAMNSNDKNRTWQGGWPHGLEMWAPLAFRSSCKGWDILFLRWYGANAALHCQITFWTMYLHVRQLSLLKVWPISTSFKINMFPDIHSTCWSLMNCTWGNWQQHRFSYNEPMPVESVTQSLCDLALRFGEDDEEEEGGGGGMVFFPLLLFLFSFSPDGCCIV